MTQWTQKQLLLLIALTTFLGIPAYASLNTANSHSSDELTYSEIVSNSDDEDTDDDEAELPEPDDDSDDGEGSDF